MVRCVSEHDQLWENGDALTALEPAHVAAFAPFSRAAEKTDLAVATAPRAAPHLSPSLNPRLARRVYAGEQGTIYIVPGPGSLGSVSIAAGTGETVIGHTTTELAALDGLGHVGGRSGDGPVTFVGVLPAGGHDLRIINRAGRRIAIPLTRDDAYWVTVDDPADMLWTTADGHDRQSPFGRFKL